MSVIEIRDSVTGSFARIAPGLGFNCFRFEACLPSGQVVSLLNAPDDFVSGRYQIGRYGNPILFPYPNRIAGGKFEWGGREFHLTNERVLFDESGNAIHGLCLDRSWRIMDQSESSVTGVFRLSVDAPERLMCWPADAEIQIRYEVKGTSLLSQIRAFNPDTKPLPWGFGTHAYFNLPLVTTSRKDACSISIPSETLLVLENCLPTGKRAPADSEKSLRKGRRLEGLKADDVYSALIPDGDAIVCRVDDVDARVRFEQKCSTDFREIVVFTPWWSSTVCMEPYTCMTNAINLPQAGLDAGLRILQPGQQWAGFIDLHVFPHD